MKAKAAKVKKPLWRRIVRAFAITLASLVVLVVAAIGALHTSWGKSFVRRRIEAKLADKINGTVSIGSLDYTFLLGEIHVGNIAIRDAQGRPAIGIAAIDIDLDRTSLLHKDPLIDRLALHGLDVSVIEDGHGGSNLKGLFKPSKDKPTIARLRVARLSLDGAATIAKPDGTKISVGHLALSGALEARPLAQELDATLAEIGAHVSIAKPGAAAKELDLAIGGITLGRRATSVDVRVADVSAGPLGIESLDAHAGLVAGRLAGDQKVALAHVRVDRAKLAALLGHELLRDDLLVDLTVSGPTDHLVLDGSIQTGATKLELDGEADVAAARPAYRVALLGDGVQSSAVITKKPLPTIATDVRVEVRGTGIKRGDVDAQLDLAIHALGVDLTGSGAISRDRAVAGNFSLKAEPAATITAAAAAGIRISPKLLAIKGQLPPRVELAVSAAGSLDGELGVTLAPTTLAVARGHIGLDGKAVLERGKLATASAHVSLAALDLVSLAALAGKPAKAAGKLSGTVALTSDGERKRADYDLSVALAKPAITLATRGSADPTSATAHATISHAGTQLATLDAQLPLGKRGGKLGLVPSGNWKVAVNFARRPAADLAGLLPEKLRAKLPHGELELHLDVAGTPANPTATLALAATDSGKHISVASTLGPSAKQTANAPRLAPLHLADGVIDLQPTFGAAVETTVTASAPRVTSNGLTFATKATVALGADTLALVDANVAVPSPFASGSFDIKALRAGATVDATIDLPARSFGSLASLRPALARLDAKLGGQLEGHITARGPLAEPVLDATLRWFGYKTAAGTIGTTELVAYGTPKQLTAKITHNNALAIVAQVDRSAKDRIAITASAHAAGAPLLPMLPAFLASKIGAHDPGHVHSEMYGSFALVRGPAGMKLEDVDVSGSFDVTGASIALPKSTRRYDNIGLALTAEPHGVRLTAAAHERDVEDRDRRVEVNGMLAFESKKPAKLDLSLVAHDWLLFGSQKLGPADAPRAAADFDISVAADLTKPIASVDATVNSLTLRAPERFERGHYAEVMEDDIIELRPGMTAGKLPVIVAVAGEPAPKKRHPMDIRVHIPRPIRINQTPMDLLAHGELTVTVRDEGVKTRGVLTVDSGTLFLFGHYHDLVAGTLGFTDEHPHGWMDMTFERTLPDSTRRDQAQATPGARVSLVGELSKPKPSLSGAAGGLDEAMALQNAGHGTYVTRPEMPASETVQAPRGDQLGVMTFLAGNLPKMTFLDRIAAWSDPGDSKYGQIKHVEADRYGAGDKTRVRAIVRPQQPGRSSAEIQVDRLLIHSDRAAAGVGVRAGDRLGGGVGFFVEWSSKD